ncbi:unnamed protein product [Arctogadus glacialis]
MVNPDYQQLEYVQPTVETSVLPNGAPISWDALPTLSTVSPVQRPVLVMLPQRHVQETCERRVSSDGLRSAAWRKLLVQVSKPHPDSMEEGAKPRVSRLDPRRSGQGGALN